MAIMRECGTHRRSVPDTALLKCTIREGMFPHEVDLMIQGVNRTYEALVDSAFVQGQTGKDGLIGIEIIARDAERDAALVELPRQVVMGGRRIWVPRETLLPAE